MDRASNIYRPSRFRNPWLISLLLATAGGLVYANILQAPFVFDDASIWNEPAMHARTLPELFRVFSQDSLDRQVGYFTFALNFYWGGLNTSGYHLVNIVIHLVNGWLVFWLVRQTLSLPVVRESAQSFTNDRNPDDLARQVAFFTALIWLVHPVHIQAVTYIVQRLASLSAGLFLASLSLYVAGRLRPGRTRYGFYGMSALAGLLAMGVKQNVATLPFFIFLYELYFFHHSPCQALKKRAGYLLVLAIFFISVTLVYLGPHFWDMLQELYAKRNFTMTQRLLSETRVIVYYISLLALPLPSRLRLDYDFPISTSLFTPLSTLFSALALIALLGFALRTASRHRLLSFTILWFFGNLAVESTIIPLDLVYEHRLYLPSMMPVAIAVVYILDMPTRLRLYHAWTGPVVLLAVAAILAFWTYERNQVWTSAVRLWTDNARKAPGKARVHTNLGKALLEAGRYEDAVAALRKAVQLDPNSSQAYNNLASIYMGYFRQYDKAKLFLDTAYSLSPNDPDILNNLAIFFIDQDQYEKSISYARLAIEKQPNHGDAYNTLGEIYFKKNQYKKALDYFTKSINSFDVSKNIHLRYFNIALTLERLGKVNESCTHWSKYLNSRTKITDREEIYQHAKRLGCF